MAFAVAVFFYLEVFAELVAFGGRRPRSMRQSVAIVSVCHRFVGRAYPPSSGSLLELPSLAPPPRRTAIEVPMYLLVTTRRRFTAVASSALWAAKASASSFVRGPSLTSGRGVTRVGAPGVARWAWGLGPDRDGEHWARLRSSGELPPLSHAARRAHRRRPPLLRQHRTSVPALLRVTSRELSSASPRRPPAAGAWVLPAVVASAAAGSWTATSLAAASRGGSAACFAS